MKLLVCAVDPADRKLAAFLRKSLPEGAKLEVVSPATFSRSFKSRTRGAFVYFVLPEIGQRKALALASKLGALEGASWGILDPAGEAEDPAAFFFEGGRDYIGPKLFKSGTGAERLAKALAYASSRGDCEEERGKIPFPGWDKVSEGEQIEARFCHAAMADQEGLAERIGEKHLGKLKEEFASFMDSWARECGGIAWIRDSSGCLLLFPPEDEQANPVLSAFRLLLDRVLVGYEVFRLQIPLSFRFAFHAGRTVWRKPGATGTVVSEDVNYVFHLGQKAAGDGIIIVSDAAADSIPACMRDLFSPAGNFEGCAVQVSRRFRD